MLFALVPARADRLKASCNVSLFLGFAVLVVPVLIPKRENVVVPHFFYQLIIDSTPILFLQLLLALVSPLDEYSSQVVDPLASLLRSPCL